MRAVLSPEVLMGGLGGHVTPKWMMSLAWAAFLGSLGNCPLRMQPGCHKALFE